MSDVANSRCPTRYSPVHMCTKEVVACEVVRCFLFALVCNVTIKSETKSTPHRRRALRGISGKKSPIIRPKQRVLRLTQAMRNTDVA